MLKHRKLTCLHSKIDFIYIGLVIGSLVPHSPYNPSLRHIKSKLMCRHVNSYDFTHFGLGLGGGLVSYPTKLDLISKNLGETTTLHKFGGKFKLNYKSA